MAKTGTTEITARSSTSTGAERTRMQKISPHLWFDDQAEEAAEFYVSIFNNSRILKVSRYSDSAAKAAGRPKGSVMTVAFQLEGQDFVALNGGPIFKFSEAISFLVNCNTQKEIDELWEKLSDGGEEGVCGWLKDQFGLSWQIVPSSLGQMLTGPDAKKADRVMAALLPMKKIDIKTLEKAYAQR